MRTHKRTSGPLSGVRVVELAAVVAGPTAGQILADLGADVIKVEPPGGDAVRHVGAAKDGVSLWWKFLGRNKRSIAVDLSTAGGRDVLLRLVDTADILIESYRPGTLERWGLAPGTLRERNRELIIARITGYGRRGDRLGQPAFGTLAEAMSGFASLNGAADGPPTLPPVALADYLTGFAAAIAALAALRARDAGQAGGQVAELNLLAPLLAVLNLQIVQCDQTGIAPRRLGSRMVTTAPRNVYATADDRWIAVSGTTRKTAAQLLRLAGRPDLPARDWFATGAGRYAHAEELDRVMADWARQHSLAEILGLARAGGATVGPVNEIGDLLDDDQLAANDLIVDIDDPDLGPVRMPNLLFELDRTPGAVQWLGEGLGESTEDVLGELDLTPEAIAALREAGAIR
ncbi:MAG TPA: CoA transferase [Streptosporangiaceae bacterium]|nr:CoA transferase [Streptosporangiaceae bacterium]